MLRNILASLGGIAVVFLATSAISSPKKPAPPPAQDDAPPPAKKHLVIDPSTLPASGSATVAVSKGKASLVVAPGDKTTKDDQASKDDKDGPKEKAKEDPIERAKKGVVTIERGGEILALGTVLRDDGRVLTALSPLGDGNGLDLRYPDGSTVHAKVGHSDRVWDLALLVPQVGRWPDGLMASDSDALKQGAQLRAFTPGRTQAQPATILLRGKRTLLGADEQLLRDVFDVGTKIGAKEFGSPVVDDAGNVVAVLGRACVPVEKGPCAPTAFGVPVDAVRQFLRTVPPSAVPPAAWLGIQGVADASGPARGVRVVSVSPESPADEAGLKGPPDKNGTGDVVVAVDDVPVATPDALSRAIREKAVGDRVRLLVFGGGKFREVTAVLTPAPSQR